MKLKIRNMIFVFFLTALCLKSAISSTPSLSVSATPKSSTSRTQKEEYTIDNLFSLARVLSAASLRLALSNPSIPIDDILGELLNVRDLNLRTLENSAKVNGDELVNTFSLFKEDAKDVEVGLAGLEDIKVLWSRVGDLYKWPDNEDYRKLDGVKVLNFDYWFKDINIENFNKLDQDGEADKLKKTLQEELGKIEATRYIINYKSILESLERFRSLSALSQVFNAYDIALNLSPENYKDADILVVASNFGNLNALINVKYSSEIAMMHSVVSSRKTQYPITRVHMPGFVNGFKDLENLKADSEDEWIHNLFGNKSIIESSLMEPLIDSLNSVNKIWENALSFDEYLLWKKFADLMGVLNDLNRAPTVNELNDTISSFKKCMSPSTATSTIDIAKTAAITERIRRKVSTLWMMHDSISKFNTVGMVNNTSEKTSKVEAEYLKRLIKNLRFQSKILYVDNAERFSEDLKRMDNKETVTTFTKSITTSPLIMTLDCLKTINVETVPTAAKASLIFQGIKTDDMFLNIVNKLKTAIATSLEPLNKAREILNEIKKSSTVDIPEVIKNIQPFLKTLGEGLNAFASVDRFAKNSPTFTDFIIHGQWLKVYLTDDSKIVDKNQRKTFQNLWANFDNIALEITENMFKIESWNSSNRIASKLRLEEFGKFFQGIADMNDIDLPTDQLVHFMNSVENVPELKTDTSLLSKLDLKFSRFRSSVMFIQSTLDRISEVLTASKMPAERLLRTEKTTPEPEFDPMLMYFIQALGAFLIASVVVAGCVFCMIKFRG